MIPQGAVSSTGDGHVLPQGDSIKEVEHLARGSMSHLDTLLRNRCGVLVLWVGVTWDCRAWTEEGCGPRPMKEKPHCEESVATFVGYGCDPATV